MTGGLLASVLLGIGVLAYVLVPLFRRDAAEAERVVAATSGLRDLQSRREMLMASLRDLEDDHATGKLDDADYGDLRARLTAQAADVMRRLDALKGAP